jgi:hypothetical protein
MEFYRLKREYALFTGRLFGLLSQSVIRIYPSSFSSFCSPLEHYIAAEDIDGSARIISAEIVN